MTIKPKSLVYILSLYGLISCNFLCNPSPKAPVQTASLSYDFGVPPDTTDSNENKLIDEGAIGDVKYSILKPELFIRANGNGWVLLAGQPITEFPHSGDGVVDPLIQEAAGEFPTGNYGPRLPDARGVFLRGMNENLKKKEYEERGNPDPKNLGEYQLDENKKHSHSFSKPPGDNYKIPFRAAGMGIRANNGDEQVQWLTFNESLKIDSSGGSESRPRNISLYIYVKVRKAYKEEAIKE
jgi:hypothetical protein